MGQIYVGAEEHEGWVGKVFEDGSLHGGGEVIEVDRRTVAWRAACECGWRGEVVVLRRQGQDEWASWEELPELEAEWETHVASAVEVLGRRPPHRHR